MRQVLSLTGLLLRAFSRDFAAVFFTVVLPLLFMLIFGALNLGALGHVNVGIVDQAQNQASAAFVDTLRGVDTLAITTGDEAAERARLLKSDRDLVIVIPADFRIAPASPGSPVPTLVVYENQGRAQQAAVGEAILTQLIDRASFAVTRTAPAVELRREEVSVRKLGYLDFLVPGIIGLNVMQLAIFGVAFGLVSQKQRGVLRRIMATPLRPRNFLAAHVLMRLLLAVLQVAILIGVAVVVFKLQIVGSIFDIFVLVTLGSILFLTFGFAIAGWAKTENQVPPIANLITLPMFFLSGTFFSRDAIPAPFREITAYLPLTFLNDALRDVSTQGATLFDVGTQVLGLAAWGIAGFIVAVRLFRLD